MAGVDQPRPILVIVEPYSLNPNPNHANPKNQRNENKRCRNVYWYFFVVVYGY